jgi:hypothetical protein
MIDHLVYATPDMAASAVEITQRWGVTPTPGGRHIGRGTHNALVDLGNGAYLEIIGPDPEQQRPPKMPFGIESLTAPRLLTWAAKAPAIEARVARARAAGFDPGEPEAMSRQTPAGELLKWKLSRRDDAPGGGLAPFLIDWGETPHPSASAARGCRLTALRGEHPDPAAVGKLLAALGVDLPVTLGAVPALIATIETPRGTVELR